MRASVWSLVAALAMGVSAQRYLSDVDGFSSTNCRNYKTTWSTEAGTNDKADGKCFTFPSGGYPSIMVTGLDSSKGCEVTVYSDTDCSNKATSAALNACISSGGPWKSFSTDGCSK